MIKIREAIVVEGRYDINALRQIVDTVILETGGFRIFNDKERLKMLRKIASVRGILVLTDSDGAGFVIRNFIKGALPMAQVKHAYIPDMYGKESRKRQMSKEGKLGVEGMRPQVILEALQRANATIIQDSDTVYAKKPSTMITKADLYALGLSGGEGSAQRRKTLLKQLELPEHLSTNALLEFINAVSDIEEVRQIIVSYTQNA